MGDDSGRVARLARLAHLWGAVTYFHPRLPFSDVDWDSAVAQAAEATAQATSKDEFAEIVRELVAVLGDPGTYVPDLGAMASQAAAYTSERDEAPSLADAIVRDDKGNAVVLARRFPGLTSDNAASLMEAFDSLFTATSVVIDLRRAPWHFATGVLNALVARFLDTDLVLPARRTRRHAGFPPETGATSGGYEALVAVSEADVMYALGAEKGAGTPLALVVDDVGVPDVTAAALQHAGRAVIVASDLGGGRLGASGGAPIDMGEELVVVLRTADIVSPHGTIGWEPDAVVKDDIGAVEDPFESAAVVAALDLVAGRRTSERRSAPSNPPVAVKRRPSYPTWDGCPPLGWRLLALFKQWTVIRLFFPYLELCDRPWDDVLEEFIPRIEQAETEVEYATTIAEAHARIQDSHGYVQSATVNRHIGTHAPAVAVRAVEGRTVVSHVEGTDALAVGDVVVSVDGEPVERRIERLSKLVAASTPQALSWRVHVHLLQGDEGTAAVLEVEGSDGALRRVEVVRDKPFFRHVPRSTPVYQVLPEGVGYVDLDRLDAQEVDAALAAVSAAPALVFDMRGYPNQTAWAIAPRLHPRSVPAARFRRLDPSSPHPDTRTVTEFVQWTPPGPSGPPAYEGRIFMLIDETAVSQAEHTCLFIESCVPVTFVGSPTNGANGDVTTMILPGGITCMFSGQGVWHADGRQLQRAGVQPDIEVRPTIAGIRAGRDEVLEAAVAAATRP